jgi:hypothetical protein
MKNDFSHQKFMLREFSMRENNEYKNEISFVCYENNNSESRVL